MQRSPTSLPLTYSLLIYTVQPATLTVPCSSCPTPRLSLYLLCRSSGPSRDPCSHSTSTLQRPALRGSSSLPAHSRTLSVALQPPHGMQQSLLYPLMAALPCCSPITCSSFSSVWRTALRPLGRSLLA
ncbi:hypothetical protein GOP47_0003573, partial [Adiantum capillus-veneris]